MDDARREALLHPLDRAARRRLLGVDRLLAEQRARGRAGGRRLSADAALRRDEIAQLVIYAQACNPDEKQEAIVARVMTAYGVGRRYIFKALEGLSAEREANIRAAAAAFAAFAEHHRLKK